MADWHDPGQQAEYLAQALSQDKLPLGILLGAGCPCSIVTLQEEDKVPLIPDIAGLTDAVYKALSPGDNATPYTTVLDNLKEDGHERPTIEDILSHVRSLRQIAGSAEVRGLRADALAALDKAICDEIVKIAHQTLPPADTPYHALASWTASTLRSHPLQFFTPNYDLLLEQALEARNVPYFDGFVGSYHAFFDPYAMEEDTLPSRWARVWKLHGSINWIVSPTGQVCRTGSTDDDCTARLIHPSHLKYDESRKMPYLAMADRMRAFFRQSSPPIFVVCGYSFKDQHINETLEQGLRGNPLSAAFALLHGPLSDYPQAVALAQLRPNLSLLADDAAVVGMQRAAWIEPVSTSATPDPIAVKRESAPSPHYRLALGDFAVFATFLAGLMGPRTYAATSGDN